MTTRDPSQHLSMDVLTRLRWAIEQQAKAHGVDERVWQHLVGMQSLIGVAKDVAGSVATQADLEIDTAARQILEAVNLIPRVE